MSNAAATSSIAEQTLGNGLKALVLEKHGILIVAAQVWYRVGSHMELADHWGCTIRP
jgi:predicted Zn-dependent peptidase